MQIIYQPKIALFSFLLIFLVIYLFYLFGEKKYKKGTPQTIPYFSGERPSRQIKLGEMFWGFFKDLEKLYLFLEKTQIEDANHYNFLFIFGLTIFLLAICLI